MILCMIMHREEDDHRELCGEHEGDGGNARVLQKERAEIDD